MSNVLIHIGYPKTGSTYLQDWFFHHPKLLYHPHAIAGFQHSYEMARYAESGSDHSCYVLSNEDLSVWKGEASHLDGNRPFKSYDVRQYQIKLAELLHRLYPQGKVLIVLRGYRTYFQSMYSQYLSSGGPLCLQDFITKFGHMFPLTHDYNFLVNQYRRLFGMDQVILMPYELLQDDPRLFLSTIESSIGIEPNFAYKTDKINPSIDPKVLYAYFRVSNFIIKRIGWLPYEVRKPLYETYIGFIISKRPHPWLTYLGKLLNREIDLTGIDELIKPLKGKAKVVKDEELFQPYLVEYLI